MVHLAFFSKERNGSGRSKSIPVQRSSKDYQDILVGVKSVQDHLFNLGASFDKYEGQDHSLFKSSIEDILTVASSLEQEIYRVKQNMFSLEQDSIQRYKNNDIMSRILILKLVYFVKEVTKFLINHELNKKVDVPLVIIQE